MRITNWPDIIRGAGIKCEIVDGFATRSKGELPEPEADGRGNIRIVWHHDASPVGPTSQWLSSAWDSGQPSAQIWIDTNGTWFFIGSGQASHAGVVASGMPDNSNSVGIETDHTTGEDWPPALLDSMRRGTAALLAAQGRSADFLFFHKQIAPSRKVDPDGLEIDSERRSVDTIVRSGVFGGQTIPAPTGSGNPGAVVSSEADTFKKGVFSYLYLGQDFDEASTLFTGDLAPVNDQQLIGTIQAICTASLRSFMSGPDGSFIAFFPDYFGIYAEKDSYKLTLEDIELVDFKIDINDDEMATDVFVAGDNSSGTGSAGVGNVEWLQTRGVANIRQAATMSYILGKEFADPANFNADAFYQRFGLRPFKAAYPSIYQPIMERLQAITLFQRKWAAQFRTQVSFTFMPELQPGMRILIKSHNVTVYVEEVVHTGSFDGGFSTTATISAPAAVSGGGITGMVVGKI